MCKYLFTPWCTGWDFCGYSGYLAGTRGWAKPTLGRQDQSRGAANPLHTIYRAAALHGSMKHHSWV